MLASTASVFAWHSELDALSLIRSLQSYWLWDAPETVPLCKIHLHTFHNNIQHPMPASGASDFASHSVFGALSPARTRRLHTYWQEGCQQYSAAAQLIVISSFRNITHPLQQKNIFGAFSDSFLKRTSQQDSASEIYDSLMKPHIKSNWNQNWKAYQLIQHTVVIRKRVKNRKSNFLPRS